MNRTLFIACNILRDDESGQHIMTGTGSNGDLLFTFEISREIANELSEKMQLQIITIKKQKSWQEGQENAEAVNAVALQ